MNLDVLKRPLATDQIDFKVSQLTKTDTAVWASILAYKDARVDMTVLDEAVGPMNWQVTYQRDSQGVLQSSIGIWDDTKKTWVWKTSNGTPSDFEGEKGEYSDAFKRAGFFWGIGRQLYNFPPIWVQLNDHDYYEKDGKIRASNKLRPNDWKWTISTDYQKIKAERKFGNTWTTVFNNHPYDKENK